MDVENTNTYDYNTGNRNTGSWNAGNRNTGDYNSGNRNTGDGNTGYSNTGDGNTGDRNTGDGNTGNFNVGDWNTGNFNVGFLNTVSPTKWLMFNKECELWNKEGKLIIKFPKFFYFNIDTTRWVEDMTEEEEIHNKNWKEMRWYLKVYDTDKTLHTYRKRSFEKADIEDVAKALELPNFDYEIFEEITGITKEDFDRKLGTGKEKQKTIVIDGVEYVLTPKNPL